MAIEVPAAELFKVETPLEVRWGDMDALGHVNNTRYFGYFEEGRVAWFARAAPGRRIDEGGVIPLLAHTACDYLAPVEYPATLVVSTRALRLGTSSVTLQHLVRDAKSGRAHAVGEAVIVFWNLEAGAPSPLDEALRAGVRALDGI